ncbi:MAG: DUF3795 domain-containing protein [Planctomycetota bacterium]
MDRRDFVKATALAAALAVVGRSAEGDDDAKKGKPMAAKQDEFYAAPCGLYCGACEDNIKRHECHGCGCTCKKCAGDWHYTHCPISKCSHGKGLRSCVECDDMPCTKLIHFTFDIPSHRCAIENLRRQKKIGREQWLKEQAEFHADPDALKQK